MGYYWSYNYPPPQFKPAPTEAASQADSDLLHWWHHLWAPVELVMVISYCWHDYLKDIHILPWIPG